MAIENYIEYVTDDMLSYRENSQALVVPVNCVGTMGKGLALKFKEQYPDNFESYKDACSLGQMQVGRVFVTNTLTRSRRSVFEPIVKDPIPVPSALHRLIINFPTKRHWRDPSQLEWIDWGLQDLVRELTDRNIRSVAIPALGCGEGGLEWRQVKILIEQYVSQVDNLIATVYEPG